MLKALVQNVSSIGIDVRRIANVVHLPRYFKELFLWIYRGGKISGLYINLNDYHASAGHAKGHYFHQDLVVASEVFKAQPDEHLDIGSRIDGFVAHVASFMKIKVADVRPLVIENQPNIEFLQLDLMEEVSLKEFSSVSCLHAIEHFGLGRYNDPINPNGSEEGLLNLIKLVKPGGRLYLSHPISHNPRTIFNAHRILPIDFSLKILENKCDLIKFFVVDDEGDLKESEIIECMSRDNLRYGCGIYIYEKKLD